MRDQSTTAPTRVIVLDLVSFVLLAAAAGLAFGVVLGGMTLLFASQTARADTPPAGPGRTVIERPLERPTNNLPETPAWRAPRPAGTLV